VVAACQSSSGGQAATVLVVDGEEAVRAVTTIALDRLGYRVLLAGS
jgi:CheY-like chemotaxis protein